MHLPQNQVFPRVFAIFKMVDSGEDPVDEVEPNAEVPNKPFPSYCGPHYESEAKCKSFSYEN